MTLNLPCQHARIGADVSEGELELHGLQDEECYISTLTTELGATRHPSQTRAYILDGLPFYAPKLLQDHISIFSFNEISLADALIELL